MLLVRTCQRRTFHLCPSLAFSRLKHPFRLRTQKLRLWYHQFTSGCRVLFPSYIQLCLLLWTNGLKISIIHFLHRKNPFWNIHCRHVCTLLFATSDLFPVSLRGKHRVPMLLTQRLGCFICTRTVSIKSKGHHALRAIHSSEITNPRVRTVKSIFTTLTLQKQSTSHLKVNRTVDD